MKFYLTYGENKRNFFLTGGGGLVDLDIVCQNDVKIKVHKVVMAAASSFFRVRKLTITLE